MTFQEINRMKENIDDQFSDGIELRDSGQLTQAVQVFLNIIQSYPNDSKIAGTYTVLAGIYFDLNDFKNSFAYFTKAIQLKPQSELASLGLYLSHVQMNDYEMAINELKRYLDQYPAVLYKDTLEELLGDVKGGYALKFKDTITELAKMNGMIIE